MKENTFIALTNIKGTVGGHPIDITISVNSTNEAEAVKTVVKAFFEGMIDSAPGLMAKIEAAAPTIAKGMLSLKKTIEKLAEKFS